MNIYINGKFLIQKVTGVQRFAEQLVYALDQTDVLTSEQKNKIILYYPHGSRKLNLKFIQQIELKNIFDKVFNSVFIWEQIFLLFKTKGNLLVNFTGSAPFFKNKQIVSIHDSAIYEQSQAYSLFYIIWYRVLFYKFSKTALMILTCSMDSKKRIQKYLKIPQIQVIYSSAQQFSNIFSSSGYIEKIKINSKKYFLTVGSLNPTKNFKRLIAVYLKTQDKVDFKLVVVGASNSKIFSSDQSVDNNDKIVFTGHLNDSELKELYTNAYAFIFPSYYEGFGIPPIEAMSCGCPVIVSNATSIPEVCGDAAIYFDPFSEKEISDAILRIYQNPNIRANLIKNGYNNLNRFSWSESIKPVAEKIKAYL